MAETIDFEEMMRQWHETHVIPAVRIARIRRGKYVRIPPEWRGQVTNPSTIRKRQSKHKNKLRNLDNNGERSRQERRAPTVEEFLV